MSGSDVDSGSDSISRVHFSRANKNYMKGDNFGGLRETGNLAKTFLSAPIYNAKDPTMWRVNFLSYSKSYFEINHILEGIEKFPQRAPGESKRTYKARCSYWTQRSKVAHQMISSAVIRAAASDQSTTSRVYVQLVESIAEDQAKLLWDELRLLNDEHGKAEKTLAVINWAKNDNRDSKKELDEYSTKQTELLQRVEQLGTTLKDVNAILFMNGLPSTYHKVIQSFMDKPSFTQDEVYRQAKIYDHTKSSMKSVGLATDTARTAETADDNEDGFYGSDHKRQ